MSSNLFNRMLIISGWPAVLLTDAKSTVKNAGPVSTYYTTSADFISNERFFPRFYRTKSKPQPTGAENGEITYNKRQNKRRYRA